MSLYNIQQFTPQGTRSNIVPEYPVEDVLDMYIKNAILTNEGQYEDYDRLVKIQLQNGAVTDSSEMGSGKTREAIAMILREIYLNDNLESIMIVTSSSVIKSWPSNILHVYNDMDRYCYGGIKNYMSDGEYVSEDIYPAFKDDIYDFVSTMRNLSSAMKVIATTDSVTKTELRVRGNKKMNLIFCTNTSISDIGFAYFPTLEEIAEVLEAGGYNSTDNNISMLLYQGYYTNPNDPNLISRVRQLSNFEPRKYEKMVRGHTFNLDLLKDVDVSRFGIDNGLVRGSGSKGIVNNIRNPKSTIAIFDEFYKVSKDANTSYYSMYFINYLVSMGNKVMNISGTPFDDYDQFTNYLSANAFFTPHRGITHKLKLPNSKYTLSYYNKQGINIIMEYLFNTLDPTGELNGGVLRKFYNLDFDATPGSEDINNLYGFYNNVIDLIGQVETEFDTSMIEYIFMKYLRNAISSSVIIKNIENHFSRRRNLTRTYCNVSYTDEEFKKHLGSLKPKFNSRKFGGSVVTKVEMGLEINMIPNLIFRTIEILKQGDNRVAELDSIGRSTPEELSYKGNRVIIYMRYIDAIIFIKYALIGLSKFFGIHLDSTNILTLYKSEQSNRENSDPIEYVMEQSKLSNVKVIIVSYTTGSEGLSLNQNLTEYGYEPNNTHILVVQSYMFNLVSQSISRVVRSGIVRRVEVEVFINNISICMRMMARHWHVSISKNQPEIMTTYGLFELNGQYLAGSDPYYAFEFFGKDADPSQLIYNMYTLKNFNISNNDIFSYDVPHGTETWRTIGLSYDTPIYEHIYDLPHIIFNESDYGNVLINIISMYNEYNFVHRSPDKSKGQIDRRTTITEALSNVLQELYQTL